MVESRTDPQGLARARARLETSGNGTTIRDRREEATGTTALCRPRLTSIIVIGGRSIIVTTLTATRASPQTRISPGCQGFPPGVSSSFLPEKTN